jgi:hypothetical protein
MSHQLEFAATRNRARSPRPPWPEGTWVLAPCSLVRL